jgi:hypothetical protein
MPPDTPNPPGKPTRFLQTWKAFFLLLALALLLVWGNHGAWFDKGFVDDPPVSSDEAPQKLTFDGHSDQLAHTVVLPTLQSPLPEGNSVLWCTTLAMAWQKYEIDICNKEPLLLKGAEKTCQDLSRTPDAGLEPKDFYVAAGFAEDNILERIRQELFARFPKARLPINELPPNSAMTFAYLEVDMPYEFQFNHLDEPFHFQDHQGQKIPVHAFGIRKEDKDRGVSSYRTQVRQLFRQGNEFALDLCKSTTPYQIILARLEPKATLQATLDSLTEKIAAGPAKGLGENSILLVPSMHWQVDHNFRELEGKTILTPPRQGLSFGVVFQYIHFKMDQHGTMLHSGALGSDWNGNTPEHNPDHYLLDRPFLVVLKNRNQSHPFFVMWVNNAELLQRYP